MLPLRLLAIAAAAFASVADADDTAATKTFRRGARRSCAHHLLDAPTHRVLQAPPPQFALVPAKLDMWGNDQFGDCVTAEEAFAKACFSPEIFIDPSEVTRWARRHGYLNGADLASVLQSMRSDGFLVGSQQYDDGAFATVDYSSETVLQSALATGPVKIAIDANALPDGAGNQQGWFTTDCGQQFPNTDHCVSLCGYGPAEYLYGQLGVSLPAALPASTPGYLLFTWSTIGFVTHDWLMTTCAEAWVRDPTTVGNPPLTPTPAPPPAPDPSPVPGTALTFAEAVQAAVAVGVPNLTDAQVASVETFFGDGTLPRVKLLRDLVYRRALRAGVIPAGTSVDAVDWQGLIEFIQALAPIIEQLMLLFGGGEHHAALAPSVTLCAGPSYRAECTPFGCRRVPAEKPAAESPAKPKPKCGPKGCRLTPQPRFKFFRRHASR